MCRWVNRNVVARSVILESTEWWTNRSHRGRQTHHRSPLSASHRQSRNVSTRFSRLSDGTDLAPDREWSRIQYAVFPAQRESFRECHACGSDTRITDSKPGRGSGWACPLPRRSWKGTADAFGPKASQDVEACFISRSRKPYNSTRQHWKAAVASLRCSPMIARELEELLPA